VKRPLETRHCGTPIVQFKAASVSTGRPSSFQVPSSQLPCRRIASCLNGRDGWVTERRDGEPPPEALELPAVLNRDPVMNPDRDLTPIYRDANNGNMTPQTLWGPEHPVAASVNIAGVVKRHACEMIGGGLSRHQLDKLSRIPDGRGRMLGEPHRHVPRAEAFVWRHLRHDLGAVLASPRVQRHEPVTLAQGDEEIVNATGRSGAFRERRYLVWIGGNARRDCFRQVAHLTMTLR
jgi:hypothetical protein